MHVRKKISGSESASDRRLLITGSSQRLPLICLTAAVRQRSHGRLVTYATDCVEAGLYAGTQNNRYPDVYRISKFDIRINEKIDINITSQYNVRGGGHSEETVVAGLDGCSVPQFCQTALKWRPLAKLSNRMAIVHTVHSL